MVKRFISLFDLQDIQLVAGIASIGYGLYLVYPPSAYIGLGLFFISPTVIPYFRTGK